MSITRNDVRELAWLLGMETRETESMAALFERIRARATQLSSITNCCAACAAKAGGPPTRDERRRAATLRVDYIEEKRRAEEWAATHGASDTPKTVSEKASAARAAMEAYRREMR